MHLTEAQRKHLRRLAHDRKVVVQTGSNGITEALLKELRSALARHELLKVKVVAADRDERETMIAELCEQTGAELIQRVGHVATLFKRNAEDPKIPFPGKK